MRVVRSNNFVMATEKSPAQFRPGNQARLQRTRASNPSHAEAESFAPNPGEARSGNMVGDNGLSKRSLRVHQAILTGSKTLSFQHAVPFSIPMPTISGAPPRQLDSPATRALTIPMPPADVRGMDGLGRFMGRGGAGGNLWSSAVAQAMPAMPSMPRLPGIPTMPGMPGIPMQPNVPSLNKGGWASSVPMQLPTMKSVTGGPAEFHPANSFRNVGMHRVQPAVGPTVHLRGSAAARLTRPNEIVMRGPTDNRIRGASPYRNKPVAMFGLDGLGALDTPSLLMATAAIVGVYFLTKNRRLA